MLIYRTKFLTKIQFRHDHFAHFVTANSYLAAANELKKAKFLQELTQIQYLAVSKLILEFPTTGQA